jgi:hypothetical protein
MSNAHHLSQYQSAGVSLITWCRILNDHKEVGGVIYYSFLGGTASNFVFIWFLEDWNLARAGGQQDLYVGHSISKLQIQVATYVF